MMSRPQPNLDLIDRVLQQIDAEPERWNQGWWSGPSSCGTAYCFGGWAVALSGGVWTGDGYTDTLVPERGDSAYPMADYTYVEERATRLLGLTQREADRLFDSMNSREDLQEIVDELRARTAA